ncbi:hypothetical protein SSS_03298 [Sarcoptes scabiei]|uniref:Uncharacterized protein n=1 Tax=Sarcoptes scabiei TaxID=52283 RepID=A0A834R122_SARSC|nr:hypothetical protein SSS_03298 [Sarcoptes scabiei]
MLILALYLKNYHSNMENQEVFQFLMIEQSQAILKWKAYSFLNNSFARIIPTNSKRYHLDYLLTRIIHHSLLFVFIGSIGLGFPRKWQFLFQMASLICFCISLFDVAFILDEREKLIVQFRNSIREAIRGHNLQRYYSSFWLQISAKIIGCCGWRDPSKEFDQNNIPGACCRAIKENGHHLILSEACSLDRIVSKTVCSESLYFRIIHLGSILYISFNVMIQIIIINLSMFMDC